MADLSIRRVEVRTASLASMDCLRSAPILSVSMPAKLSLVDRQRQHDPVVGHAGTLDEQVTAFGKFDGALDQRSFAGSPFDFEFVNFLVGGLRPHENDKPFAEIKPAGSVGFERFL